MGSPTKMLKKLTSSKFWKGIKAGDITEEAEKRSDELAKKLHGERVASGGLAVHPATDGTEVSSPPPAPTPRPEPATGVPPNVVEKGKEGATTAAADERPPLTDQEIEALIKKYGIKKDQSRAWIAEDRADAAHARRRGRSSLVGEARRPSIGEIEEAVTEGDRELIKKGREVFPDMSEASDEEVLALMKMKE